MRSGGLRGDWMEFSYERLNEVCRMIGQVEYPEAIRYLREPAVRTLNLRLMDGASDKEIIHYEIVSSREAGEELTGGASFAYGLKTTCFMVDGDTAWEMYRCAQWFDEEDFLRGYTCQTEYGLELDQEYVEDSELHFLTAFLVIQHLMLHCRELLSYRVEECKPARSGKKRRRKHRNYRKPGKVLIYTISRPETDGGTPVSDHSRMRTWHCDAWGVRGHYRRLRSGRMSYVRPYVKGRKKDAYNGREYVLFKEGMEA